MPSILGRFSATLLLLLAVAVTASPSRASEEGFQPLFDGESLGGWVQRGGAAIYEVNADAATPEIVGTSVSDQPNSFLCTPRDYGDFVLEFEVKVDPSLNSGVQFRSQCYDQAKTLELHGSDGKSYTKKVPAGRVHGYQAEIDPSPRAFSGGVYDEARRGWLFDLKGEEHADARAAFDPKGWNQYRIEAIGDSIRTFINGAPVADFTDSMTPSGFIALQVHSIGKPEQAGKQIRWRNLRIKEVAEGGAE